MEHIEIAITRPEGDRLLRQVTSRAEARRFIKANKLEKCIEDKEVAVFLVKKEEIDIFQK